MTPETFSLLERVKQNPAAYLGHTSLSRWISYQMGYNVGLFELGVARHQYIVREDYHHWITRRLLQIDYSLDDFRRGTSTPGTPTGQQTYRLLYFPVERLITLVAADDQAAFGLYCSELNEWKRECIIGTEPTLLPINDPTDNATHGLIQLLDRAKRRARLHACSLTKLRAYIDGYLLAFHDHTQQPKDVIDFSAFQQWLQDQTPFTTHYRWEQLILLKVGCEDHAFFSFFEYLRQFLGR